jgi:hypothetical protein
MRIIDDYGMQVPDMGNNTYSTWVIQGMGTFMRGFSKEWNPVSTNVCGDPNRWEYYYPLPSFHPNKQKGLLFTFFHFRFRIGG